MEKLCAIFNQIGALLNSAFTTSLVGALAGACAGAWAAQQTAAKHKRIDEGLKEFRSLNAALVIVGVAFDTAYGYKKQFAKPVFDRFQKDRQAYVEHLDSGHPPNTVPDSIVLDSRTMKLNSFGESDLRTLLLERTSATPLLLSYVNVLCKTVELFGHAVQTREEITQRNHVACERQDADTALRYFFSPQGEDSETGSNAWDLVHRCNEILFLTDKINYAIHARKLAVVAELKKDGQTIPEGHGGGFSFDKAKATDVFPTDLERFQYLVGGFEGRAAPSDIETLRNR